MLAVGLALAACQAGFSIYFTNLDDMVRNLKEAENTGRFAKKLQTYLKCSCSTRSDTSRSDELKPTWSSNSSPAATNEEA